MATLLGLKASTSVSCALTRTVPPVPFSRGSNPVQRRTPLHRHHETVPQSAAGDALPGPAGSSKGEAASSSSSSSTTNPEQSFWGKVKEWFSGAQDKEKLARLGMAAFLSYGVVSNVTYGICVTIAWVTFVRQKGVSPLAGGQWPEFLAFYAGLFALQNIIRPARFAFSVAMAPVFDRLLDWIAQRIGGDKKVAFGITLVCMAITTSACLFGAIYLLGGLPDGLGPFPPLKRF